jgi:hypothetical protein
LIFLANSTPYASLRSSSCEGRALPAELTAQMKKGSKNTYKFTIFYSKNLKKLIIKNREKKLSRQ